MAIKCAAERFGIAMPLAYHKIAELVYTSSDRKVFLLDEETEDVIESVEKFSFCSFVVYTYHSKEARDSNKEHMYKTEYKFELEIGANADDVLVQAYNYLKSQDEYKGAVDA